MQTLGLTSGWGGQQALWTCSMLPKFTHNNIADSDSLGWEIKAVHTSSVFSGTRLQNTMMISLTRVSACT